MLIIFLYVGLFLALGLIMFLVLKENWDMDDRPWFRIFIASTGIIFYDGLFCLIWFFVHDPVVLSLRN